MGQYRMAVSQKLITTKPQVTGLKDKDNCWRQIQNERERKTRKQVTGSKVEF